MKRFHKNKGLYDRLAFGVCRIGPYFMELFIKFLCLN